jgi:hypothetical protein
MGEKSRGGRRRTRTLGALVAGLVCLTVHPAVAQTPGPVVLQATSGTASDSLPLVVDLAAPVVTVTSPISGSLIAGTMVTVTGTVTDAEDTSGTGAPRPVFSQVNWNVVDGTGMQIGQGSVPVVSGQFTIPNLALGTGYNQVQVAALDEAGNIGFGATAVTTDPNAPPIAVVNPPPGSATLQSSTPVDLDFAAQTTLVSVNGVADGRTFTAGLAPGALNVPLQVGANVVTLVFDSGMGPHSFDFTLFRVAAIEPIRIATPVDGSLTNVTPITVTVIAPLGTPVVQVNRAVATPSPDGTTFTAQVPLQPGPNNLQAIAAPFGQQASAHVTFDNTPPDIALASPQGGESLDPTVEVAGRVNKDAQVTVSGRGGTVLAQRRFDTTLSVPSLGINVYDFDVASYPLLSGSNTLTIQATDLAGNTSSVSVTVVQQSDALVLVTPLDGSTLSTPTTDVTLQVLTDSVIDAVYVAGFHLPGFDGLALAAGGALLPALPLSAGPNQIRIVSHRANGTGAQEVLDFTVDSTSTDFATVHGTITDASGNPINGALVIITPVSGIQIVAVTNADGTYSTNVTAGPVSVTATDQGFQADPILATGVSPGETLTVNGTLSPVIPPPPLPSTVTLAGVVSSNFTNLPVPGVLVSVLGTSLTATTDSSGHFEFANLTPGATSLRMQESGFLDGYFTFDLEPQANGYPITENFSYPSEAGNTPTLAVGTTAQGKVVDALTDGPLTGAQISGGSATAVSDANGMFSLAGLSPGAQVAITATLPGHTPETLKVLVVPKASDPLRFMLPPLTHGVISGTVTDAVTGQPISFAGVSIVGSTLLGIGTNPDGTYNLASVPQGTYTVRVDHPNYLPVLVPNVSVTDGQTTPLTATLTHRPTTGTLSGQITDAGTGSPIQGAVVALSGGSHAITDSSGVYTLAAVPAGLVSLTITASGYPTTTQTTSITADVDLSTPTTNTANFAIDTSGSVSDQVSQVISAAQGGSIETPDGRLKLDILPGSLDHDAEITLRTPPDAASTLGSSLTTDPVLGLGQINAVGPETEILVGPASSGGVKPNLTGPVFVSARYFGSVAAQAGVNEDTVFPYLLSGTSWTVLRIVPYMDAVDTINKLGVVALLFGETETDAQVFAYSALKKPILVAQTSGLPPVPAPLQLNAFRLVPGAAPNPSTPYPPVAVVDLAKDPSINPTQDPSQQNGPNQIANDALPLLVFHGWDWLSTVLNGSLVTKPLNDARFGPILRDLLAGTKGVYRPIFVTYNSRHDIMQNAEAIGNLLNSTYPVDPSAFVEHFAPPGVLSPPAAFLPWDAFAFSMGGLVARSYQATSTQGGALQALGAPIGSTAPIQNMVTLGSPHHGALDLLDPTAVLNKIAKGLIGFRSPGTTDLLSYQDDLPCEKTFNPFLCNLNNNVTTVPNGRLNLIGGDATLLKVFKENAISAADLEISKYVSTPNDLIVPLKSALGVRIDNGQSIPALQRFTGYSFAFDHFHAGETTDYDVQRIAPYMGTAIFPYLTDAFVVASSTNPVETCPNPSIGPGLVHWEVTIDYNTNNGDLTAATLVAFVQHSDDTWSIVAGADPNTLLFDHPTSISGNSVSTETSDGKGTVTLILDKVLPATSDVKKIFVRLYTIPGDYADSQPSPPAIAVFAKPCS